MDSNFGIKSIALNCSLSVSGGAEKPCYATLDPDPSGFQNIAYTPVSFNISAYPDNNNSNITSAIHKFKIWTLGAEDGLNGFIAPPTSGWYPITISAKDYSYTISEKVVDFSYVRGSTFGFFDIISTIRNYGAKNLFTFRFYLPSGKTLNAYDHSTYPGRIFIEFSTIN